MSLVIYMAGRGVSITSDESDPSLLGKLWLATQADDFSLGMALIRAFVNIHTFTQILQDLTTVS